MNNINLSTPPRYEFRIFSRDLKIYYEQLKTLNSKFGQDILERTSVELYLGFEKLTAINCKIRNNIFDIKQLYIEENNLQQWSPVFKASFPISSENIKRNLCPILNLKEPLDDTKQYSQDAFLEMLHNNVTFNQVPVEKKRYGFLINSLICEYARVNIDGTFLETIACESEIPSRVYEMIDMLKLTHKNNTSYPMLIREINKSE